MKQNKKKKPKKRIAHYTVQEVLNIGFTAHDYANLLVAYNNMTYKAAISFVESQKTDIQD